MKMSAAASPTPTALAPGPLWVNEHNYGPLVSIITWFLIITSFLSVSARVGTRLAVVKRVYADDITIMVALVCPTARFPFLRIADDVRSSSCPWDNRYACR